jgi:hypothetical protein
MSDMGLADLGGGVVVGGYDWWWCFFWRHIIRHECYLCREMILLPSSVCSSSIVWSTHLASGTRQ